MVSSDGCRIQLIFGNKNLGSCKTCCGPKRYNCRVDLQTERGTIVVWNGNNAVQTKAGHSCIFQVKVIYYSKIFAAVVSSTFVRILVSSAALLNLRPHQIDALTISAFLNGDLDEQGFMEQPSGYEQGQPAELDSCLKKSLLWSQVSISTVGC